MSDTPAKRQAYSFAFPPDKKQAFTKIADEKYQRPASWLLLQAIDQVIANGGLLGDETYTINTQQILPPISSSEGNGVSIDDVRSLIDQAIDPLTSDLVNIQSQLINRDNWDDLLANVADLRAKLTEVEEGCDFTTEGIQRLIADAISKALIPTAKQPQSAAIRTASAPGEVHKEVLKVANRLEREPALKSAVIDGLAAGHTSENLGQYLADNGFLNSNGGKYTGASNSRFRLAIEYLNSLENGGQN